MPYIIKQGPGGRFGHEHNQLAPGDELVSEYAVATLEEARTVPVAHIEHASIGSRDDWADAHYAAQTLPESGGTVGPLPDGTIIEVRPS